MIAFLVIWKHNLKSPVKGAEISWDFIVLQPWQVPKKSYNWYEWSLFSSQLIV